MDIRAGIIAATFLMIVGALFVFRSGVLHADGEGYYDTDGLIVECE